MKQGGDLWKSRLGLLELDSVEREISYAKEFGKLLGAYLCTKNFSSIEEAKKFLSPRLSELPHPHSLKNLKETAVLLADIVSSGKALLVYGDYDVDGMSGLTLASSFFKRIGYKNFQCYQPHRFDEGYGVHSKVLERIHQSFAFDAVLTVDTGVGAVEAAEYLKNNNIQFFITDHHLPPSKLPESTTLVNPNQGDCESNLKYLCGTGVLFFVLAGLKLELTARKLIQENKFKDVKLDEFLDVVALATVSDQMDLIGCNRVLVKEGLKRWPQSARPGLRALTGHLSAKGDLSAKDIAFSVAPKLNAASRMGKIEKAIQLLNSESMEEAQSQLAELVELNTVRVESQAQALEAALEQVRPQAERSQAVLFANGKDWAEGVLGIVAAKLVEEFQLPAIVVTDTPHKKLRGSMRSPEGFHCVSLLEGAKSLLSKYGGHEQAAGLEINPEQVQAFEAYLKSIDHSQLSTEHVIEYDSELLEIPTIEEVRSLSQSAPWGRGNPAPLFKMSSLPLKSRKILKEKHVKWDKISGSILGFGFESLSKKLEEKGVTHVDVLVTPELSEFKGRLSVVMMISKLQASTALV